MDEIERTAARIAREAGGDRQAGKSYALIMKYLIAHPEQAARPPKRRPIDEAWFERSVASWLRSRAGSRPSLPSTVPDPIIKDVLQLNWRLSVARAGQAIDLHLKAMAAESFIGWALEAYIASESEKRGWAWCGSMIKAVDFIRPFANGDWLLLQIKNRDNSENYSSARVRVGTEIKMWFRSYAATGATNWENFPDDELAKKLNEDGFKAFITKWLRKKLE